MSEKTLKFSTALDRLIDKGKRLAMAMDYECYPDEFREKYLKALKNNETKYNEIVKNLPQFRDEYQSWYSEALALIKQVLPDRLSDFISYFEIPKGRKSIDFQNYMIRDYLQGLRTTRGGEVVADRTAAIPDFFQQLKIVIAAKETLESALMDLKGILQADLFDSEVESAGALAKAGYLRAAGAICGVVIEKHLHHVCHLHKIPIRKKNPGISDLSQMLKDEGVTTVPQWRFIQHLADIRNLCDHAKEREPTKEEIADLIAGTEKVLKTVF
jgi:hypothetical protein